MREEPVVSASEHHVQLFDSSKSLAETVSTFLIGGLQRNENAIVVATPEHRELLSECLDRAGWNVRILVDANRLFVGDAVQCLAKSMRQVTPRPIAFHDVHCTVVNRMSAVRRDM